MAQELSAATPASLPLQQRLDALIGFRHSPATAASLEKIYGSTPPWSLVRLPAGPGAANYRGTLAPLHFKDADGSTVEWAAFPIDIAVGADGRSASFNGIWPQLVSVDKTLRVTVRDVKLVGQQQRSADNLWFGSTTVDIAGVAFEPVAAGPRMAFEGIRAEHTIVDRQRAVEMAYGLGVRRIAFGAEGIDQFKLATRVTGIDRQSLLELQAFGESKLPAGASAEQRKELLMPLLKAMARGAVRSGTALEIDELSASFHGQTVRASGHVGLEGAVEADADNVPALLKKLVVRLSVKAPLALVREVTTVLADMQVRAKNKGVADARTVAQLAATMNDVVLGKMVSSGYVRVDGDTLSSDIDYSAARGGLRINGKPAQLPTVPPGVAGAAPIGAGAATMLQARRIDARCTLPDYPQDVIKTDAPLSLTMRLIVKADGSVRNVTLTTPSTHPDYDQAVLAAAARCTYIPALRNGDPIDAPVIWKVVREAGTTKP